MKLIIWNLYLVFIKNKIDIFIKRKNIGQEKQTTYNRIEILQDEEITYFFVVVCKQCDDSQS